MVFLLWSEFTILSKRFLILTCLLVPLPWGLFAEEVLEGWQVRHYTEGQKREEGGFVQGLRSGFWFFWHPNGQKVS